MQHLKFLIFCSFQPGYSKGMSAGYHRETHPLCMWLHYLNFANCFYFSFLFLYFYKVCQLLFTLLTQVACTKKETETMKNASCFCKWQGNIIKQNHSLATESFFFQRCFADKYKDIAFLGTFKSLANFDIKPDSHITI